MDEQNVGEQQETQLPPPVRVESYRPMFMAPAEKTESGEWALRFMLNPVEHVMVLIPEVVAVALREQLPAVTIHTPPKPQIVRP